MKGQRELHPVVEYSLLPPSLYLSLSADHIAVVLTVLAVLPLLSRALYDKSDDVFELTSSNFDTMVINSEHVWVVEFYAPW